MGEDKGEEDSKVSSFTLNFPKSVEAIVRGVEAKATAAFKGDFAGALVSAGGEGTTMWEGISKQPITCNQNATSLVAQKIKRWLKQVSSC